MKTFLLFMHLILLWVIAGGLTLSFLTWQKDSMCLFGILLMIFGTTFKLLFDYVVK